MIPSYQIAQNPPNNPERGTNSFDGTYINIFLFNPPMIPITVIPMICPISSGINAKPEPMGFNIEYTAMEEAPIIEPKIIPSVIPDKNTVTDINSTLGINKKTNPNPIAVEVKTEAFTKLFNFIIL